MAPLYNSVLKASGYAEQIVYMEEREKDEEKKKKNRRRNIIWHNLPFSKTVGTNVAQRFLQLVEKYFPPRSRLNKILISNTVKVSYSCMQNMSGVLKAHNNSVLRKKQKDDQQRTEKRCNCRDKVLPHAWKLLDPVNRIQG